MDENDALLEEETKGKKDIDDGDVPVDGILDDEALLGEDDTVVDDGEESWD
jgi:hypothetical protein